ncbi:MAG: hypothetical protein PVH52_05785, partial [bacterium]
GRRSADGKPADDKTRGRRSNARKSPDDRSRSRRPGGRRSVLRGTVSFIRKWQGKDREPK